MMKKLFCLLGLAATALVTTVPAQTVSPNPAPTIITSAPYTITKSGYYQLGADLYYAGNSAIANDAIITINAGNVTLDFGGHYISGPANTPTTALNGIFAYERGNLNIQNGTITYCANGIYLTGSGATGSHNINQRIQNMLISYCYFTGVYLSGAHSCQVTNNRISYFGNSVTTDQVYGILFDSTGKISGNVVSDAVANGQNTNGIYASTNNVFVTGNTVSDCYIGFQNGHCQQDLTANCTKTFVGGVDDSLND